MRIEFKLFLVTLLVVLTIGLLTGCKASHTTIIDGKARITTIDTTFIYHSGNLKVIPFK